MAGPAKEACGNLFNSLSVSHANGGRIFAKVLDAMGDEDAVEELFKQDPLQEGLVWAIDFPLVGERKDIRILGTSEPLRWFLLPWNRPLKWWLVNLPPRPRTPQTYGLNSRPHWGKPMVVSPDHKAGYFRGGGGWPVMIKWWKLRASSIHVQVSSMSEKAQDIPRLVGSFCSLYFFPFIIQKTFDQYTNLGICPLFFSTVFYTGQVVSKTVWCFTMKIEKWSGFTHIF